MAITQHFVDTNHTGESAGQGHRQYDLLAYGNATVLSGAGIHTCGADLVSPLCTPEKQIDQETTQQRQQKSQVEGNALRQSGNEPTQPRNVRRRTDLRRFHNGVAGNLVVILGEVTG